MQSRIQKEIQKNCEKTNHKYYYEKLINIISKLNLHYLYSGKYARTVFKATPPMSSYLNAFVISDLAEIGISKPGETAHHIWVRADSIDKVAYALDQSVHSLKALEQYTGFIYELSKVDSVAIPNKGGAMEVSILSNYK
jgi:aminopeptidase N